MLDDKTEAELVARAWELYEHDTKMATNETYFTQVVTGQIPDPRDVEDYDPDDPWYSFHEIEAELGRRVRA